MTSETPLIIRATVVDGRLPGFDPFIFGAFHEDYYPKGNGNMGPDPMLLAGRDIGMDFTPQDGWRMYHGTDVPGFPAHPHRGFETVTIVSKGLVDHADSLGASARYGEGDVQWLTTGRGVEHGEMFPLVHQDQDNPLELYQLWLNLPAKNKMADPDFKIFWEKDIPVYRHTDDSGNRSEVQVIAGDYAPVSDGEAVLRALPPPTASWASEPEADVAIWLIRLNPGASITLPAAASKEAKRALYFLSGDKVIVGNQLVDRHAMLEIHPDRTAPLQNASDQPITVLLLQGKPIGEPVVAQGPFVLNTQAELIQTIRDYQQDGFGDWTWPSRAQTFGDSPRFAKHADGRVEHPPQ